MRGKPPAQDKFELAETLLDALARDRQATIETVEADLAGRGWTRERLDATLAGLHLTRTPPPRTR